MSRLTGFLVFLTVALAAPPVQSQSPSPVVPKTPDSEMAVTAVRRHGWSDDGLLVLGVEIKGGKFGTNLGGLKGREGSESLLPFSMGTSTLIDLNTGAKLAPRDQLPTKPFFGAGSGIIKLAPGDTVTFGVAFPRPPAPPRDDQGNIAPYKLRLLIPDMAPLEFTIPYQPPAAPAPR